jgi:hypothetical protein
MTDRLTLLKGMMSIPRRVGMAITVAAAWRNAIDFSEQIRGLGVTRSQFEHFGAFHYCLAVADRNIRRNAGPREVATVVAEDLPEMRRFLKHVPRYYRNAPYHMPPEMMRVTPSDKEAGYNTQSGELRIVRIRNSEHFVDKAEDPLVQVADACAYGFRRYFAGEKFGDEFVVAILGSVEYVKNFGAPGGVECWWPDNSSARS